MRAEILPPARVDEQAVVGIGQREPGGQLRRTQRQHLVAEQRHTREPRIVRAGIADAQVDLATGEIHGVILDSQVDAQGRSLRDKLVPLAEEVNQIALEGINPATIAAARDMLLKMIHNLAADEQKQSLEERRMPSTRQISSLLDRARKDN